MARAIAGGHSVEPIAFSGRIHIPLAMIVLAVVSALCFRAGLPLWAALGGWAAYYTRGSTPRDGAYNLACAVTGLGFGIVAQSVAGKLGPGLGLLTLPAALLLVAIGIQLMEWITEVDNIPSYLLGVLVVFASGMEGSLDTYLVLTAAVSAGAFAAAVPDILRRARAIPDREAG